MEIIKIRAKCAKEIHEAILSELESLVPEDVRDDLKEMSAIQARISHRLHQRKAISHDDVVTYNKLCYKHFGKAQDGGEFEKEEPDDYHRGFTDGCMHQRNFDSKEMKDHYKAGFTEATLKMLEKTPKDRFDFGDAIKLLKVGAKLSRDGWNGKNQYIILAQNITFDTFHKRDRQALHDAIGSKAIAFVGTSGIQIGWLASQADMLAEDWRVVEDEA